MWGRKAKKIKEQQLRIDYLEALICEGKHEYIALKHKMLAAGPSTEISFLVQCKRCGQLKWLEPWETHKISIFPDQQ